MFAGTLPIRWGACELLSCLDARGGSSIEDAVRISSGKRSEAAVRHAFPCYTLPVKGALFQGSPTSVKQWKEAEGMLRILSFSTLILIVGFNLAWADTYKCQLSDDTVFYTDNPYLGPDDCPLERVTDLPLIGIMQEPSQPSDLRVESVLAEISAKNVETRKAIADLNAESEKLVGQFRSTLLRISNSNSRGGGAASQELIEIRVLKKELLSEIDRSALGYYEKEEIKGALSAVK